MTEGERLAASGYRAISNKYRMVARLDRPDWREHMARKHSPWSFEEGMRWATGLGESAADHYRRVYSKDKLEGISEEAFKFVRRANGASHGWALTKRDDDHEQKRDLTMITPEQLSALHAALRAGKLSLEKEANAGHSAYQSPAWKLLEQLDHQGWTLTRKYDHAQMKSPVLAALGVDQDLYLAALNADQRNPMREELRAALNADDCALSSLARAAKKMRSKDTEIREHLADSLDLDKDCSWDAILDEVRTKRRQDMERHNQMGEILGLCSDDVNEWPALMDKVRALKAADEEEDPAIAAVKKVLQGGVDFTRVVEAVRQADRETKK